MDEIDYTISSILLQNSRIAYQDIADKLDMSINSIYKRVKSLIELGIIQKFNTRISTKYFPNCAHVLIFGTSRAKNRDILIDKLGENDCIYNISEASGNYVFFHAMIQNLKELDPLVSFIKQFGKMNELEVGIESIGDPSIIPPELTNLDFLIINALKDDSRKNIVDISSEIGASTKTVKRHLDRMIENKLIEFSIDWYPDKTAVSLSFIIIKLKPQYDKLAESRKIQEKWKQNLVFLWNFTNLPYTLYSCVMTRSNIELQNLETSLNSEEFDSKTVAVVIRGKNFPTWRDKHLEDKIKNLKRKNI